MPTIGDSGITHGPEQDGVEVIPELLEMRVGQGFTRAEKMVRTIGEGYPFQPAAALLRPCQEGRNPLHDLGPYAVSGDDGDSDLGQARLLIHHRSERTHLWIPWIWI